MATSPGCLNSQAYQEVDGMERPPGMQHVLLTTFLAFVLLVASVLLLWRNNLLLCVVMLVECVVALALWHERIDVSFFLIISVLGTLAELSFVYVGVWQYANPTLLGIPLWFPLAFGTTGLIGGRLARAIADLWDGARPPGSKGPEPGH
jgi:uncharacterized membrane protein YoaT (DUF817 family)